MTTHKISLSFLRINMKKDDLRLLETVVKRIFEANPQERFVDFSQTRYLFVPYSQQNGFHIGLAKERNANWPQWMMETGALENLQTDVGALAEESHFLVLPERAVIIAYENRHGPTHGKLKECVDRFAQSQHLTQPLMDLNYIFERDSYDVFMRNGRAKKVTFKLKAAKPGDQIISDMKGNHNWEASFGDAFSETGALEMNVSISMGNKREWLKTGRIRALIDKLRRSDSTLRLVVRGDLEDLTPRDFDLLGTKNLRHSVSFEGDSPYPDRRRIRSELLDALKKYNDYLP